MTNRTEMMTCVSNKPKKFETTQHAWSRTEENTWNYKKWRTENLNGTWDKKALNTLQKYQGHGHPAPRFSTRWNSLRVKFMKKRMVTKSFKETWVSPSTKETGASPLSLTPRAAIHLQAESGTVSMICVKYVNLCQKRSSRSTREQHRTGETYTWCSGSTQSSTLGILLAITKCMGDLTEKTIIEAKESNSAQVNLTPRQQVS